MASIFFKNVQEDAFDLYDLRTNVLFKDFKILINGICYMPFFIVVYFFIGCSVFWSSTV